MPALRIVHALETNHRACSVVSRSVVPVQATREAEEAEARARVAVEATREQKQLEKKLETQKLAAAAALPPLAMPSAGGRLPPLAADGPNMADTQRRQAMQAAARRQTGDAASPAPAPQPQSAAAGWYSS
eukprot:SAG22_NODE_5251_length_1052_cov_2.040923_2_plen_130_part_00